MNNISEQFIEKVVEFIVIYNKATVEQKIQALIKIRGENPFSELIQNACNTYLTMLYDIHYENVKQAM
ncbi:hypothetical protein [uncultured Clostridium sp.]|uniref:hypothetical protein n=1 Tax=uncultured Clostridium sp. TaxID=59620 RepID=UPI00263146C2|nr:hypothetical protein [uncultured Clostridium sp.]